MNNSRTTRTCAVARTPLRDPSRRRGPRRNRAALMAFVGRRVSRAMRLRRRGGSAAANNVRKQNEPGEKRENGRHRSCPMIIDYKRNRTYTAVSVDTHGTSRNWEKKIKRFGCSRSALVPRYTLTLNAILEHVNFPK